MSGIVKAFPVCSLSLARKSTKKRARRARMTKWDLKSRDCLLVGPDRMCDSSEAGRCMRSINSQLESHRDALQPAAVRSPTPSPARRGDGHAP